MADNVGMTPGSGVTMATDEVSGVHFTRVKLARGNSGTVSGDIKSVVIDSSASGDYTVISAVTGKKIYITGYSFISDGTQEIRFKGGRDLSGLFKLTQGAGISYAGGADSALVTDVGAAFQIFKNTTVLLSGHVSYFEA